MSSRRSGAERLVRYEVPWVIGSKEYSAEPVLAYAAPEASAQDPSWFTVAQILGGGPLLEGGEKGSSPLQLQRCSTPTHSVVRIHGGSEVIRRSILEATGWPRRPAGAIAASGQTPA